MTINFKAIIPVVRKISFYFLVVTIVGLESIYLVREVPHQWDQIASLRQNEQSFKKEVATLAQAAEVLNNLDKSELAKQLDTVNAALPSQKKTSGFVSGISTIASASGVVLKEVGFSPGRISTGSAEPAEEVIKGSLVRSVNAAVQISSDQGKLVDFLTNLQNAIQLVGITNVIYETTAKDSTAHVSLKVFFEPVSASPIAWEQVRPNSPEEDETIESLSDKDVFSLPEEQR